MIYSKTKINTFLLFNLPAAFFCCVRVKYIDEDSCVVTVRHNWFNKNPFNSIYFAVQAMAAELSTGALVMSYSKISDSNLSMLVTQSKSSFTKKATGRITFVCNDGLLVSGAINELVNTKVTQKIILKAEGKNEKGEVVSEMHFEWSIAVRS